MNRLFSRVSLSGSSERNPPEERRLAILHLVTVFQYMETLPDLQAEDALRERLDWKYALHMPLHFPLREEFSFCGFRRWLLAEPARIAQFQTILASLCEVGRQASNQPLCKDPVEVIGSVCRTSRLAKIWDALSQCLEVLAIHRHGWLRTNSLPHWYERYGHLSRDLNLKVEPLEQETFAQEVGMDGFYLLEKISSQPNRDFEALAEVHVLKKVWSDQYEYGAEGVRWKKEACSQCNQLSNH